MKGLLVQQKVSKVEAMTTDQRNEADELVYTSIILHLPDQVLRKVGKHNDAKKLWEELEKLYLVKSLPNCFC